MMSRSTVGALTILLLLGTAGCPGSRSEAHDAGPDAGGPGAPRAVQLPPGSDGFAAGATVYRGSGLGDQAVLLVHQLGGDQREWGPVVARMRRVRPDRTVLTVDLRGHGVSVRGADGAPLRWESFGTDPGRWAQTAEDVAAGVRFLATEGAQQVVLVGVGLGGTAALRAAVDDPRVLGVALLSPGLAYHGLRVEEPFRRYIASGRPALLWAGALDAPSAEAVGALRSLAGPAGSATLFPEAPQHGVALGAADPTRWPRLLAWIDAVFARSLPPAGLPPTPPAAPPAPAEAPAPPGLTN